MEEEQTIETGRAEQKQPDDQLAPTDFEGSGSRELLQGGRYWTVPQLAAKANMARSWIAALCKEGRIKAVKPSSGRGRWRISPEEARRFLEQGVPALPRDPTPRADKIVRIPVPAEHVHKVAPQAQPTPEQQQKEGTRLWPFSLIIR